MKLSTFALAAAVAIAGTLPATLALAADITGAGATFPAPAYTAWASEYKAKTGNGLNYQAIGSGGGKTQITNRTVDFGASDAPMANDKLEAARPPAIPDRRRGRRAHRQPRWRRSGRAEAHRRGSRRHLSRQHHRVERPEDRRPQPRRHTSRNRRSPCLSLGRLGHDLRLHQLSDRRKSRLEGWRRRAATSVQWPAGAGGKGNDGVAGTVKNTKGAMGYVEYVYAAKNNLPTALLKNKAGEFVKPSAEGFKAAAAGADWAGAKNFAASMIDMDGKSAWPIVSATFILLPKDPKEPAQAAEVIKFFDWAYKEGGATAEELHYIPLPADVTDKVRAAWKSEIKGADGGAVYN